MPRYVDADKIEKTLWDSLRGYRHVKEICAVKNCILEIEETPTADVVSQEAYEQVKWERDVAIAQLKSYGIGFGEKADVVKVKHGIKHKSSISNTGLMCTACFSDIDRDAVFCKYCGAKMDGIKDG